MIKTLIFIQTSNVWSKKVYVLLIFLFAVQQVSAQKTILDGPDFVFTKADFADYTLADNQDRISEDVWITRKESNDIFNIKEETSQSSLSPSSTLWAMGVTENISNLTFDTWRKTHGGSPTSVIGKDMVLFIPKDSVYLDVKFTAFSRGPAGGGTGGGGFSYTRSTGFINRIDTSEVCETYTNPNGVEYKENGMFRDTVHNVSLGGTIYITSLSVFKGTSTFTRSGNNFMADSSGLSYQWMDCSSGYTPILGEVNQTYVASTESSYALEVSNDICKDTSICYAHKSLNVENANYSSEVLVYPNPASDHITVYLKENNSRIKMVNSEGRVVLHEKYISNKEISLDLQDIPQGIYQLLVLQKNGEYKTYKIIRQ